MDTAQCVTGQFPDRTMSHLLRKRKVLVRKWGSLLATAVKFAMHGIVLSHSVNSYTWWWWLWWWRKTEPYALLLPWIIGRRRSFWGLSAHRTVRYNVVPEFNWSKALPPEEPSCIL